MPARRVSIPGASQSLATVLDEVDAWERDAGEPGSDVRVDYSIKHFFLSGPGRRPMEVPRDYLIPGKTDDWPMAGDYEIRIVDSNGENLVEPWRAAHFDKEALSRSRSSGDERDPLARMLDFSEDQRIQIRNQRAMIDHAEAREQKARRELELSEDRVTKLTRELTQARHDKEKAEADRDVSLAKQLELQEAYEQLEEELATFQAPIAMFVDEGLVKLTNLLGVNWSGSTAAPANNATAGETPQHPGNAPDASGFVQPMGNDPPPPGADDPAQAVEDLGSVYNFIFYDVEVLRQLVEHGIVPWELVRRMIWYRRKVDVGPEPRWEEWAAQQQQPGTEQPGAERGAA